MPIKSTDSREIIESMKQRSSARQMSEISINHLDELPNLPAIFAVSGQGLVYEMGAVPNLQNRFADAGDFWIEVCKRAGASFVLYCRIPEDSNFAEIEELLIREFRPAGNRQPLSFIETKKDLRQIPEVRKMVELMDNYSEDDEEVQALENWCQDNAVALKLNFKVNITHKTPVITAVNNTLRAAGYEVDAVARVRNADGSRTRTYRVLEAQLKALGTS